MADHHFANVQCPVQEVFLLPVGFLQLRVGSDVDAVALLVPAGRLIDGFEAMNGTASESCRRLASWEVLPFQSRY